MFFYASNSAFSRVNVALTRIFNFEEFRIVNVKEDIDSEIKNIISITETSMRFFVPNEIRYETKKQKFYIRVIKFYIISNKVSKKIFDFEILNNFYE
jgi:uncharacterized phage-associated protein